ncbi:MAG TPA: hypothetical protein VGG19_05985, partial [Tepidisphaeraceae bacterium]
MPNREISIRVSADGNAPGFFDATEKSFEKLKDSFGRRSTFGEFGELLRGGGAIIGITAAA